MPKNSKQCPECRIQLEIIEIAEIFVEERRRTNISVDASSVSAVPDLFSFHVCPKCGLTIVYAGPEIQRIAAERSDAIIGNS